MFGQAGQRVLIEQFLDGEELTIMAFTDGRTVVPMLPAQDHKRVGDGDTGPNTGGMGAYCPAPLGTKALREQVTRQVLYPARRSPVSYGLSVSGRPVCRTHDCERRRPMCLEFNARMGDPETQVVLPLLKTDLLEVIEAVVEHRLDQLTVDWHDETAVCVVMTSGGYPGAYQTGRPIQRIAEPRLMRGRGVSCRHKTSRYRGGNGRGPGAGNYGTRKDAGRRASGSLSRD